MNRLKIILRENKTLHEMYIGILASNLLLAIVALIVSSNKVMALLGVLEGLLIAAFYITHMAVSIDDALCLDQKGAMAQMRKHMLIRYVIVCIALGLICYFYLGDPIFCVISCLTVKLGAYLQPIIHRIINRSEESGDSSEGSENGGKISE